jgi:PTH1 family peptidyl-tRNA hydrolase
MQAIKLIVGLGNPGKEYEKNRHNVGFMAIDAIAEKHSTSSFTSKFHGLYCSADIQNKKVFLLKPTTYMNLSGKSVQELAHFFKIHPAEIMVIHDELDLETGRIKIKQGGSHAGHNGLKSIDAHITPNYHRLRLGISRPERMSTSNYVLGNFSEDEQIQINRSIECILNNINALLTGDYSKFMNNCAIEKSQV